MDSHPPTPLWMRRVLLAAALYNVLWGAFVVLFPAAQFQWLGLPQPNYPQLWQCIGMIVGVYGLGYGIAAFNPARHWPIVLVGFLGKIFGPLGMAQALWTGALPWAFALNCVTNDLIWWVPFALILQFAWKSHMADSDAAAVPDEATLLAETPPGGGLSLEVLSRQKPVLLVFLRHAGCTFCRETMADLAVHRREIEAAGARIALVHMGTPESFTAFAAQYDLDDVPVYADPERRFYRGLGLQRGTLAQLLGWKVWVRGARAFFSGHGIGALEGDGTQMPGVFLLHQGRVVRRFLHETAATRPDYLALCQVPAAK
jgi:peroxiredoxin